MNLNGIVHLVSSGQGATVTRGTGIFHWAKSTFLIVRTEVFHPVANLYADSHLELLRYNETP